MLVLRTTDYMNEVMETKKQKKPQPENQTQPKPYREDYARAFRNGKGGRLGEKLCKACLTSTPATK
jgi:hypothetical protein